jgi:hypothetical protein
MLSSCSCEPPHHSSDGTGGASDGEETGTSTADSGPSASATSIATQTSPGSTSSDDLPGTTGQPEVPPWDGSDPSCGDGVPVAGVYCYRRVDLELPNNPAALADFDGDGHLDILIGGLEIRFGDGTGAFPSQVSLPPTEVGVGFYMVGELDGELGIDLLFVGSNRIAVLSNDGTGTAFDDVVISEIEEVNLLNAVRAIRLDFDGDGVDDLLGTSNTFEDPGLQPLLNDGSGSFTAVPPAMSRQEFGADLVAWTATLPPVGEAGPGVAVLGAGTQTIIDFPIVVARADGAGSAAYTKLAHTGANARGIAAPDLTGDGVVDLVVWNRDDNAFAVYQGDDNGGFAPLTTIEADSLCPGCPCPSCGSIVESALFHGDFDGDMKQDIVVRDQARWVVFDPLGEASAVWLDDAWPSFVGDFNEDGVDDILTSLGLLLLSDP